MSNLYNTQPPSPPPVDHYDVIYEDEVQDLAILMAHDHREYWKLMLTVDADETINQPKLDYLKEHIAALQEEYALLSKTSKALATTGKNWMIDAAKHPADVRALHRDKFIKLREGHDMPTVESKAKDKLAAFKEEIKKYKDLYRDARSILSQRAAVHKRRKADQSDQPKVVANVNSKGVSTEVDEVRSSVDAAPDQSGQSNASAEVNVHDSSTESDEVRDSNDAAFDQFEQCKADAVMTFQDTFPERDETRGLAEEATDQYDQPDTTTDVKLPGPLTESEEARNSSDAAAAYASDAARICYAAEYGAAVRTLSAILLELGQQRDSTNKEFVQSDDSVMEQVIQILKGANNRVSTVAKKWKRKAAKDPARHQTESQVWQTMRKELHVRTLQRNVSTELQKLRSACCTAGQTGTDQPNDQHNTQQSKLDQLLHMLSYLKSIRAQTKTLSFQQPSKEVIAGTNSQQPEGFQAQHKTANHEGLKTSTSKKVAQPTNQNSAHLEIVCKDNRSASRVTTNTVQKFESRHVAHLPTSGIQTSLPHKTIRVEHGPPCELLASRWRGGFLRQTSQDVLDSKPEARTPPSSTNTAAVENKDEFPSQSTHSETAEQTSHDSDELKTMFDGPEADADNVYQALNEPSSDSEPDDIAPDQNIECSEGFDDDTKDTQTKNTSTYAILSNKENGTYRTTLLECVKVSVGHPTDKSQQCETVLLLDRASDHTCFKQSLCEKLHLPNLGPTKLSVATFLSSDEIPVDTFISQLRIRKSNERTSCLKAPVTPDQSVGQMRTALVRPEHIKQLRQGPCALCPSTETPEILVVRDLRHLFEVVEDNKPLPCRFLLAHPNVGTILVGSGRADKPADESKLPNHRSSFIREKPDGVFIDQLLEPLPLQLCCEFTIWNAKPLQIPGWQALPESRVNKYKPFSHIGLDNFDGYTTMDIDSELELDYDEDQPTSDHRPAYGQDQRKRFEVNERIVLPSDGPIPVLDSQWHADEVEKRAQGLQTFPPVYATWSQDQAFRPTSRDQFQFADYITVFCRPNTFPSLEKIRHVASSSYYPMDMCLRVCVGVHPGNCEGWHQRNDLELYLAGCLYNATLGPYRVVELGEYGLEYTEQAVVRGGNGVEQTIHGRPLLGRVVEALRQRQYTVLENQLNIVVTRLRKADGGYYPVALYLRSHNDQPMDVHADAIGIMRRVGMPKDYPIHCHYWTRDRTHYDIWTSHFPNTLFGFNAGSFSRWLSPDQLDLLRTIPLGKVTFESDAPYHGKRGSSQTIGTPAGVVRAITQFKELGNRQESLQTIAQASMANVIRMYRPDLTVIIEKVDEDVAREKQTSPSDQINPIGANTTTMFELASICDAGCDRLHRQCSDVFLVKGPDDEGLFLSTRWTRAVTDIHITTNLRNVRVTSFVHLVLCLWGGRLLQDRPQVMVQFFEELLGNPPDQSAAVLSQESDVRLALRKRFHACSFARRWMLMSSPPFQYESPQDQTAGASDAATMFQSILRLMPEALSWTYDQFVRTTVTVGHDDPDQPGPSRQAQRQTSTQQTSLTRETTGTSGQEQHRQRQQKRPRRDEDE